MQGGQFLEYTDGTRAGKTLNGVTSTFTYSAGGGLPLLLREKTGTNSDDAHVGLPRPAH